MDTHQLQKAADFVRERWPKARPRVGLVLGSGWDAGGDFLHYRATLAYADIPGLGSSTVLGIVVGCIGAMPMVSRRSYSKAAGITTKARVGPLWPCQFIYSSSLGRRR